MNEQQTPELTPREKKHRRRLITGLVILIPMIITGLILAPDGFMGKFDAIGFAICHQIEARSFDLPGGEHSPLCARCSGTFLGVLIGLLGPKLFFGKRQPALLPDRKILIVLGLGTALWGFDGANSFNHLLANSPIPRLYEPNNMLRLMTGMFNGITMGSLILPIWHATVWARPSEEKSIASFKELGAYYLAGALVILLMLSGLPLFVFPLSIISTLGVLVILTAINSMVSAAVLGFENEATTWRDLYPYIIFGGILTLCLIFGIGILRYSYFDGWAPLDPALYR